MIGTRRRGEPTLSIKKTYYEDEDLRDSGLNLNDALNLAQDRMFGEALWRPHDTTREQTWIK